MSYKIRKVLAVRDDELIMRDDEDASSEIAEREGERKHDSSRDGLGPGVRAAGFP